MRSDDLDPARDRAQCARHIAERHPELLPEHLDRLAETLYDPDEVRTSKRFGNARLFSRWSDPLRGGKHVVAVVVSEPEPQRRHWVIMPANWPEEM